MTTRLAASAALAGLALAGPVHAATLGLGYTIGGGGSTLVTINDLNDPANLTGRQFTDGRGNAVILSEPMTLPVYIGCRTTIASPSTASAIASGASGARSLAATRAG